MSAAAVPCAWTDHCVVAEAVQDFAAQNAPRLLGKERDAEAVLQRRFGKVWHSNRRARRRALKSRPCRWSLAGDVRKRSGPPVCPVSSVCPMCVRHTSLTRSSDCGMELPSVALRRGWWPETGRRRVGSGPAGISQAVARPLESGVLGPWYRRRPPSFLIDSWARSQVSSGLTRGRCLRSTE